VTHEKFIDYVIKQNDPSTYKSECLNIFKNELFYFCNPRTVTLYLKEDQSNINNIDGNDDSKLNIENLEEYLLSNRYVKPGIFDSILPPHPNTPSDNGKSIESLNNKCHQTIITSDNVLKNELINNSSNDDGSNTNIKSNAKLDENLNDNQNNSNNNNEADRYDDSTNEYGGKENEDNDTQNKEFYIYQYNIPRTFNSLQIESLTRFFIKTYVQHIYIIAYVFSHPQEYIYHHFRRTVTLPVPFEELEHGIVAEDWPNWVEEQENILIRKKEEEEAAIENERKLKEEMLLKEKERLEEELAQQKIKEAQDNIKNSLNSLLYQPSNKTIGELPEIPLVKSVEENNEQNNEDNINNDKITINNENEEEQKNEVLDKNNADVNSIKFKISNPNFRNSFLDLWKKQETVKEQKQKDLVYQLKQDYQRKEDRLVFDLSEQSLVNFERSRNSLISKIKEITGEDISEIIRHVYDPENVESIIHNSELLKDQYFTLLQKHIEEIISSNVQHILERLDAVNSELEKLRESVAEKNNPPNKKGANKKDDKKNDKNSKKNTPKNKKESSKSKSKPKKK
jgi:hypothetical protein